MTYFENLVNSIDDENPFKMDMIMTAREMLKRAYELEDKSLDFFLQSENSTNKDDDEMYWRMSCEATERAKGVLDAYENITKREVICTKWAIKNEIIWLEDIFELKARFDIESLF